MRRDREATGQGGDGTGGVRTGRRRDREETTRRRERKETGQGGGTRGDGTVRWGRETGQGLDWAGRRREKKREGRNKTGYGGEETDGEGQ